MTDAPDEFRWPLDFGSGVRGEWHGAHLWLSRKEGPGTFCGRIECGLEERKAPPVWKVHNRSPLTITPSIKVEGGASGKVLAHGFITDGKWVPCGDDPR